MLQLTSLPSELLSRIVDFVATPSNPKFKNKHRHHIPCENKENIYKAEDLPTYSGLSYQNSRMATSPRPDIASLQDLRLVSKFFEGLCTPLLFQCVKVLPRAESANRYTQILKSKKLNSHVRKVIFQTRHQPHMSKHGRLCYHIESEEAEDQYETPHEFFLSAMKQVADFGNLTHAEFVFSVTCESPSSDIDAIETPEFREVLATFFRGLVPATKVNVTPAAIIGTATSAADIEFKKNFEVVMERLTHLSLRIISEDCWPEPAHNLECGYMHSFFFFELQEYWLKPVAENLVYLKLYGDDEVYWGFFPACNLPHFPKLRTMILGGISICSDDQVDWILEHGDTLEELILDDVILGVAVQVHETFVDIPTRKVVYERQDVAGQSGFGPKDRGRDRPLREHQIWLILHDGITFSAVCNMVCRN
ncbi:hypothetical protein D6D22_05186 [Aureobasidium pullulans]|uniref:F-box domain-containing protein n=1 Tax=Aureobasidium pullulans TaxID=5580 RepID=A0A4S8XT98_AURPU|nr:hypothetical protein D6D22_05186 [Aureobasidium pullulans]